MYICMLISGAAAARALANAYTYTMIISGSAATRALAFL